MAAKKTRMIRQKSANDVSSKIMIDKIHSVTHMITSTADIDGMATEPFLERIQVNEYPFTFR